MEQETIPGIFESIDENNAIRRKYMIPKWIRAFAWLFAVLCPLFVISSAIIVLSGYGSGISFYGFNNNTLYSLEGILSLVSFVIKGAAAIGLLAEKDWAVKMAIADGITSIGLCIFSMILNPWGTTTIINGINTMTSHNLRLDLLLLIPYLIKMFRIRREWEENKYAMQGIK